MSNLSEDDMTILFLFFLWSKLLLYVFSLLLYKRLIINPRYLSDTSRKLPRYWSPLVSFGNSQIWHYSQLYFKLCNNWKTDALSHSLRWITYSIFYFRKALNIRYPRFINLSLVLSPYSTFSCLRQG